MADITIKHNKPTQQHIKRWEAECCQLAFEFHMKREFD